MVLRGNHVRRHVDNGARRPRVNSYGSTTSTSGGDGDSCEVTGASERTRRGGLDDTDIKARGVAEEFATTGYTATATRDDEFNGVDGVDRNSPTAAESDGIVGAADEIEPRRSTSTTNQKKNSER